MITLLLIAAKASRRGKRLGVTAPQFCYQGEKTSSFVLGHLINLSRQNWNTLQAGVPFIVERNG